MLPTPPPTQSYRLRTKLLLILVTLVAWTVQAAPQCHLLFETSTPHQIWQELRESKALISQFDADPNHRNLCGPTCAVNLSQALRRATGKEIHPHPRQRLQELISEFKLQPQGMRIDELHSLLESLIGQALGTRKWKFEMTLLPSTRSRKADQGLAIRSQRIQNKDLTPQKNQFLIAVVTRLDQRNQVRGDHAIILEQSDGLRQIWIDPLHPYEKLQTEFKGHATVDRAQVPLYSVLSPLDSRIKFILPVAILKIEIQD